VIEAGEVEQFFAGAVEWYRAQGLVATKSGSVEIKRLSERLVSVDVAMVCARSTGAERLVRNSHYILSIADDGQLRIRVAIALAPAQ